MKIQSLFAGLTLAVAVAVMSGCNDDISYVGGTIQPDSDKVDVAVDSFMMAASTIKLDSIYAKTSSGFLGHFYDPQFGEYKSDFICQFYCQEDFKFSNEPKDGKIDSVQLKIIYTSYIGDSLSPMRVDVYPVVKSLDRNYYTNINPKDYADVGKSLGGKGYTAYNLAISTDKNPIDTVFINMNADLGQKIYDETKNNPASFKDQNAFNAFFPGVYITNTYGIGAVLGVWKTELSIHYSYDATMKDSNDKDSAYIANAYESFIVTDEVIQMNQMSSFGLDELLQPNDKFTYLKTPAGVCTRLVIPAKKIFDCIGDRTINNLPLAIKAMPQSDWKYATSPPDALLLLPEDSLITFFEKNKIDDNVTSFKALSSTSSDNIKLYNFSNIARVLKAHKENKPEEDLNLLLIPIQMNYLYTSSSTVPTSYSLSHWQIPSGVVLRKENDEMKIKVTTSKFSE